MSPIPLTNKSWFSTNKGTSAPISVKFIEFISLYSNFFKILITAAALDEAEPSPDCIGIFFLIVKQYFGLIKLKFEKIFSTMQLLNTLFCGANLPIYLTSNSELSSAKTSSNKLIKVIPLLIL